MRSPQTSSKFLARKQSKGCENEEKYQPCKKRQNTTDFSSKAVTTRGCEQSKASSSCYLLVSPTVCTYFIATVVLWYVDVCPKAKAWLITTKFPRKWGVCVCVCVSVCVEGPTVVMTVEVLSSLKLALFTG